MLGVEPAVVGEVPGGIRGVLARPRRQRHDRQEHWKRRCKGISMEGDDVLLAEMDVKVGPKRDEWMTTLPPERKPGVTTQTAQFSRTSKDGCGDTSMWTDTPSEKAQKAKMKEEGINEIMIKVYNEAAALASKQQEKKETTSDAALVDEYRSNKKKRSKSLVEKHQETAQSSSKRKSKQERAKEEKYLLLVLSYVHRDGGSAWLSISGAFSLSELSWASDDLIR
ncbi:hypothetical protein RHGRI_031559 [Rhododendron griersonianum]|uniref:DUF3752 domain-containing protein n=1 Tax=Rhododendron griersonianum TaxID=479676 RepID=A0AAV6I921_9ERIC|nr:hypothetical protein RHGRI_031559 [Rhododendron griersonianum]